MEFSKLTAVSNMSGLYEIVGQRPNGVFIRALDSTKTQFISNRLHNFSPLDKISIYTTITSDMVPLQEVLKFMINHDNSGEVVMPIHNSIPAVLRQYFYQILPNHDEDRVHTGDIKKMIKWANLLKSHAIVWTEESADNEKEESSSQDNADNVKEESSANAEVSEETTA